MILDVGPKFYSASTPPLDMAKGYGLRQFILKIVIFLAKAIRDIITLILTIIYSILPQRSGNGLIFYAVPSQPHLIADI